MEPYAEKSSMHLSIAHDIQQQVLCPQAFASKGLLLGLPKHSQGCNAMPDGACSSRLRKTSHLVHPSIEALLMLVRGLLSPNPLGPYSQRDKKLHAGQLALEMVS